MRDGQESEKRRGDRAPERWLRVGGGGDEARGLNGRAYARGPGQTRARLTTRWVASVWGAAALDSGRVGQNMVRSPRLRDGQITGPKRGFSLKLQLRNDFGLFMDGW